MKRQFGLLSQEFDRILPVVNYLEPVSNDKLDLQSVILQRVRALPHNNALCGLLRYGKYGYSVEYKVMRTDKR
jgi:hypothetical protein